jgi:glycerophosphoryl diester phosphodiesterase
VDSNLVRDVRAAGARLVVWTVNDDERARTLASLGVDALCTDDVPRIRAALAANGAS